jgi:hypothetical protein
MGRNFEVQATGLGIENISLLQKAQNFSCVSGSGFGAAL